MNPAELTPTQIDALVGPLVARRKDAERLERYLQWYTQLDLRAPEAGRVEAGLHLVGIELSQVDAELARWQAEFDRRGGWERYYTTPNKANAHVHRRADCKTFRAATRVLWLPELAGRPPSEVRREVDPCSTCFRRWI